MAMYHVRSDSGLFFFLLLLYTCACNLYVQIQDVNRRRLTSGSVTGTAA